MGRVFRKIFLIFFILILLSNSVMVNYIYAENTEGSIRQLIKDRQYDEEDEREDDLQGRIEDTLLSLEEEEESEGGVLFTPISKFIVGIGDGIIATMQGAFLEEGDASNLINANAIKQMTPADIADLGKDENQSLLSLLGIDAYKINDSGVPIYKIKYSPAAIFSGRIPAFDINFFNPMGDANGKTYFYKSEINYSTVSSNITYVDCMSRYGAPLGQLEAIRDTQSLVEVAGNTLSLVCAINAVEAIADTDWQIFEETAGIATVEATIPIPIPDINGMISTGLFVTGGIAARAVAVADKLKDQHLYYMHWENAGQQYFYICDSEDWKTGEERVNLKGTLYKVTEVNSRAHSYVKESTAYTIRPVISSWYQGLRRFSLVALLCVLVYVGIRIVISSGVQDKVKYKKMLVDWVTAVCILFLLHYIMAFTVTVTQSLSDIFITTTQDIEGSDKFMSSIRNMISGDSNESYFLYFGYVVMYLALVILTLVFTVQYLKRLVFIAFLTMIAPLIALTYPLDKIKDGQAQAFTVWLREYVFNCLLQPLHLLLYTMFIGSASSLVNSNPVYAVIILAFFTSAEKFLRKMFGFEKASTIGALGTAAGGAVVMNLLNKIKDISNPAKSSNSGSKNIRTHNNPTLPFNNESSSGGLGEQGETGGNAVNSENTSSSGKNRGLRFRKAPLTKGTPFIRLGKPQSTGRVYYAGHGVRKHLRKIALAGTSAGRWALRKGTKAAGMFAGATIGLAAGAASGDMKNAFTYTGAGAMSGGNIGEGIANRVKGVGDKIHDIDVNKNKDNNSSDANANNSQDNNENVRMNQNEDVIEQGPEHVDEEVNTQEQTDNIRDTSKQEDARQEIIEPVNNDTATRLEKEGISDEEFTQYKDAGATEEQSIELKRQQITPRDLKDFSKLGHKDIAKIIRTKQKHPKMSASSMKNMYQLAKSAPKDFSDFKAGFIRANNDSIKIDDADLKNLFNNMKDFS